MSELLKNRYNKKFIKSLASELGKNYSRFDSDNFTADIFSNG